MSSQPYTSGILAPFSTGRGFSDFIPIATPAAGANASFTVPGEYSMRVLAAMATITTSATVANRFFSLDYLWAGVTTFVRNSTGQVITASTTNLQWSWSFERTIGEWAANTPVLAPVLAIDLPPGTVVRFTVDNIQAADQLSALSLFVEKFETGDRGYPRGVTSD